MNSIAIYYENTIIYWNSIIIVAGIIAGFFISLAFYKGSNRLCFPLFIYFPLACICSIYLSKILHWYCHIEQYESFSSAINNLTSPGYLLPGVVIATWLCAILLTPILRNHSRFSILDPIAPGLAFIIAIIKFSDIFSETCLGKVVITNPLFHGLPFSKAILDDSGNIEYRFATFFITFILMVVITVMLVCFYLSSSKNEYNENVKKQGHVFRAFIVLYSSVEIVMDSTRYDASHLYFPGESLESLNKGAGFMGISQFLGAVLMLYCFIYYLIISSKAIGKSKKHILPWILFIIGLGVAGYSEYLVQRHSSMYITWYATQSLGVISMIISIYILYRTCIIKKAAS